MESYECQPVNLHGVLVTFHYGRQCLYVCYTKQHWSPEVSDYASVDSKGQAARLVGFRQN
jgi:hypothetical protein